MTNEKFDFSLEDLRRAYIGEARNSGKFDLFKRLVKLFDISPEELTIKEWRKETQSKNSFTLKEVTQILYNQGIFGNENFSRVLKRVRNFRANTKRGKDGYLYHIREDTFARWTRNYLSIGENYELYLKKDQQSHDKYHVIHVCYINNGF